jgi:N-acetylneuraminic acid mutarotase
MTSTQSGGTLPFMRAEYAVAFILSACVPDARPVDEAAGGTAGAGGGGGAGGASRWSTRAPIPEGRSAAAAGVLDGLLYVAGGYAVDTQVGRVDVYDPSTDHWGARAPLPITRHTDSPAVAVGGMLYVVGGSLFVAGGQQCTYTVTIYDPAEDAWHGGPPMPGARCWAAVAAVDDRIYVAGGTNTQGSMMFGDLYVLDVTAGTWSSGAPLPTPRIGMGVITLDGRIYFIGGVSTTVAGKFDLVEVYDPAANEWAVRTPMPTARQSMCVQALEGRIHVIGGQADGDGHATAVHEIYDPALDEWSEAEPMPTARIGPACGVLDGSIVVTAGVDVLTAFGVTELYTP